MINNCHASKKQDIKSAKDMDPYRSYDDQKMRQRIREEIENELGRKPETIGEFIKRHQK